MVPSAHSQPILQNCSFGQSEAVELAIPGGALIAGSKRRLQASVVWASVAVLAVLILLTGCQATQLPGSQTLVGRTMGTTYSIKLEQSDELLDLTEIARRIENELEAVNNQMSTYIATSEVSRFNNSASTGSFKVSRPTAEVVQQAIELSAKCDGAFDITVGPLVDLWGFGIAKREMVAPPAEQIEALLPCVGYQLVSVELGRTPLIAKSHPTTRIDLSAIAKGHGVDRVAKVLEDCGATAYFIEIGGEVRVRGLKLDGSKWRVGIELPNDTERELMDVLELQDQSLATSGNYRNFFETEDGRRYSHTIDPKTGYPIQDPIAQASSVAETCTLADGIATVMMSSGFEKGRELAEQNNWAVLLVTKKADDFETWASTEFKKLFPDQAASYNKSVSSAIQTDSATENSTPSTETIP